MTSIDQQLKEVEREISLRKQLYPKWVTHGRLNPKVAALRIETMEAVAATLRKLQAPDLFDSANMNAKNKTFP